MLDGRDHWERCLLLRSYYNASKAWSPPNSQLEDLRRLSSVQPSGPAEVIANAGTAIDVLLSFQLRRRSSPNVHLLSRECLMHNIMART